MLIAYHPQFFAVDLAQACADLADARFRRIDAADELPALAAQAQGIILSAGLYTAELAASLAAPGCATRWLQFTTAGIEPAQHFGVPASVVVTNASAAWGPGVAEHAVALLLASLRRLPELAAAQSAADWAHARVVPLLQYLDGARIGLLGMGAIGQGIAARLRPFGAEITAFLRTPREQAGADRHVDIADIADHVADLDALVSSLPLTRDTAGLVGAGLLARLPDGCVFVNVGRGGTVDEPALLAEIASGRLRAALDVFETEPLPPDHAAWSAGGLIVSPHLAALGGRAGPARLLQLCRDNIIRLRDGRELLHRVRVDPPAVPAGG